METRPRLRLFRYLVPVVIVLAILFSVRQCGKKEKPPGHPRDYAAIAKEGILRIATEYNSISFYVDGDTVSGFHYELIEAFARDKGLQAEIIPLMSFEERLKGLAEGRFDVIAFGILATSELKDSLLLTTPIVLNKQVLVQRKATEESDSLYIHSQLDLAQRTLHVVKGSPSILRIQNLGNEIGDTIYIKEIEKYGPEQLISLVAHGDIDYAVCDESIARAVADSLPQIDINTAISFTQFYSWAVSKQSPVLLDSLNTWLDKFQKEAEYQKIYKKYYDKKRTEYGK
ncbi:transporter substrate-binding domain-containing protein [Bacteroides sp. f07]|uniref:transporter substrate-binding domain-containing protein n=1 Tax=Bacteroides sp. f07 TaxID=3132704 RepID=UPI0034B84D70